MIPNQWYAILPSQAVQKTHIVGVKRLNLDLALFRDESGTIGCVADQCTHRGAALSQGKVLGNCVQCPFHGLQFDVSGRCTFIPANGTSSTCRSCITTPSAAATKPSSTGRKLNSFPTESSPAPTTRLMPGKSPNRPTSASSGKPI